MYDMAGMMEDLLNRFSETIPDGIQKNITLQLTDSQTVLDMLNTAADLPWTSFTIFNDGPGNVYFSVNTDYVQENTPLKANEKLSYMLKKQSISKIILKAATGTRASVRLFALK
jgi:hypothetical protein